MEIQDIINSEKPVEYLKRGRKQKQPDIKKIKSELNSKEHRIFNKIERPDKEVVYDTEVLDINGNTVEGKRLEPVARLAFDIQKLIVNRSTSFTFGNPAELIGETEGEKEAEVKQAISKILYDVKGEYLNKKIARELFSCTEVAELWYVVKSKHNNYGFPCEFKLKTAIFSPLKGDILYPFFNDYDDLIAFSRQFVKKDIENNNRTYFETYTSDFHYMWEDVNGEYNMVEGYPKPNILKKIPVVYASQPTVEWESVQTLIERLEKLASNFADTNDYHAAPKVFIQGQVKGFAKKGETGQILEGEEGATAQYLSWDNAPVSVRDERDFLLKMIYTLTQTADISYDTVKGMLGNFSGVALKMLFTDTHLKVRDKEEILGEYLQRRINILLAYLSVLNNNLSEACKTIQLSFKITPFAIESEQDKIETLIMANGGKPLVSHKTSVGIAALSSNTDEDYQTITKEAEEEDKRQIFEPTEE